MTSTVKKSAAARTCQCERRNASFYMHEAAEATKMAKRGMLYEAAHQAALDKYRVSPFSVHHPEVIKALPEAFNSNWRAFWGIK